MYKNIVFIDKEYINKKMEDLEKELSILNNQYRECNKPKNIAYTKVLLNERYPNWVMKKLLVLNEIERLKQITSDLIIIKD